MQVLLFDAYIEKLIHTKSKSSFLDDTSQEITLTNTITCRNEHVIEWLKVRHKQRQHQAIQQQQQQQQQQQEQQQQQQRHGQQSRAPAALRRNYGRPTPFAGRATASQQQRPCVHTR